MIVEVNDFGIEWQKSDKVVHKADFDDLIRAYEKLEKIEQLYEPKPFGEGLSREDRDKEIERIVKG